MLLRLGAKSVGLLSTGPQGHRSVSVQASTHQSRRYQQTVPPGRRLRCRRVRDLVIGLLCVGQLVGGRRVGSLGRHPGRQGLGAHRGAGQAGGAVRGVPTACRAHPGHGPSSGQRLPCSASLRFGGPRRTGSAPSTPSERFASRRLASADQLIRRVRRRERAARARSIRPACALSFSLSQSVGAAAWRQPRELAHP